MHFRKAIERQQIRRLTEKTETCEESEEDHNYKHAKYPITLNSFESLDLLVKLEKLKHHLQNLLTGTKEEKVIGKIDHGGQKLTEKSDSNQLIAKSSTEHEKIETFALLNKILKDTGFKVKNSNSEYTKTNIAKLKNNINLFVIDKPCHVPIFRCIPNRAMLQRLINRYMILQPDSRDSSGKLMEFPKFNSKEYQDLI